jgi:predicted phosphodiesterase
MPASGPRIALLADVHGNLPALEAVLADARGAGATAIWNAGDCVGYGPFPRQCVELLREACDHSVIGNYDAKVLKFPRKRDKWSRSKQPLKFQAFEFAWQNLDRPSRDWLAGLPRQVHREVAGREILLVHATVLGDDEPVGSHTSVENWRLFEEAAGPVDLVLAGHLHRPFDRPGAVRFVFAGSVGRPEDGDPRAHYTLIDLAGLEIVVKNRRVAYDIERTVAGLRDRGAPVAFSVMARCGVDLKEALDRMESDPVD